jgi:hypothetical protein
MQRKGIKRIALNHKLSGYHAEEISRRTFRSNTDRWYHINDLSIYVDANDRKSGPEVNADSCSNSKV